MRLHRFVFLAAGAMIMFFATGSIKPAQASRCTLMKVSSADKAELRVYFTRFTKEDSTGGRYKKCRLVKRSNAGTQTFFITPFRKDAGVIVHPSNWPR